MKSDSTPFLPLDGIVYVIDSLDPGKKILVQVAKTNVKSQRTVIESLACPNAPMRCPGTTTEAFLLGQNMGKELSTNLSLNKEKGDRYKYTFSYYGVVKKLWWKKKSVS